MQLPQIRSIKHQGGSEPKVYCEEMEDHNMSSANKRKLIFYRLYIILQLFYKRKLFLLHFAH